MPTPKYFILDAFGLKIPLPKVAVYLLAFIVVAGIGWSVYQKVYEQPERQLIDLQAAYKQRNAEIEEYGVHVMEDPQKHELFEDADGKVIVRIYKDHCVVIQRQSALVGTRTRLVMDLARPLQVNSLVPAPPTGLRILPVLLAQAGCNRGCLNPHPGPFRWWYGRQDGPWVEVWRQWPEGCTHVQMFNSQGNYWDSNPDGSPRVKWTCCVH